MVTVKKILNSITIAVAVAVIMLSLFARTPQLRKPRNGTVGENEPEMGISKKNSNNVAIKRSLPLIAENPLPPVKRSLPLIAEKPLPPIALVICAKNKHYLTEVTVLLKSAASLTTRTLRFIILTRSKKAFRKITSIQNAWPEKYKRRIRLERHGVETSRKKKELSFCGSVGLFLPDILSEDDSAVLLKADSIFLRPPEQLLSQVHKFNGSHAIGVAQTLRGYIYQNPEVPLGVV
ncbi:glucoside xylosyltransferase 1-like [Macrobrachium rosenbergii]|uniref:glucoside xylosyltransferase 1-like n=1 Tax=Macrobrachium rosenbergii TaxID=79674 RepID=UPI0034D3CF58